MSATKKQLQIAFKATTENEAVSMRFEFEHTEHSFIRACQRGFNQQKIATVLQFGECFYKQGLIFYVLGEHNIPKWLTRQKKELQNTVVVVAGNSNQVITCYRRANPFKYIRTKSEKLCKNYNNAA